MSKAISNRMTYSLDLPDPTDPGWVAEGPACDLVSNFRAILDTIADGVIVIDEIGTVQWFNPAAERLFGYQREDCLGRTVSFLMPEPDRGRHDGYLANYLGTGIKQIIGIGREVQGCRKDGSLFPMYLSIGEQTQGGQRADCQRDAQIDGPGSQ